MRGVPTFQSQILNTNNSFAVRYCPYLFLSSLLCIPWNGMTSFRISFSMHLHFMHALFVVQLWRFFKPILRGDRMIVSSLLLWVIAFKFWYLQVGSASTIVFGVVTSISIYTLCFTGHLNNLYDTCFWKLVKDGKKSETEAHECLKVLPNLFLYAYSACLLIHVKGYKAW